MSDTPEIEILDDIEKQVISAQSIKDMIDALSHTEDGEPLKNAMSDLKKALLENPTACALLLPADIGDMVKFLMKVTGKDLELQQSASGKKAAGKKDKERKFDFTNPDTLKALEDDLF